MYQLHNLESLVKKRKRIGRGGERGGTSGRGHKGQKARSGGSVGRKDFEGGQIPLVRRLPKRGFNNTVFADKYQIVNLDLLEQLFNNNDTVTKQALIEKGCLNKRAKALKVLGNGTLSKQLKVYADAISESASKAIVSLGGEVHLTEEK